ncbi:YqjF family protein [Gorillibacterium massiliense]|uniref:YqjF family protein n=1 Tax=Gorillibacterium massiliense TaxID=1280390 RepID=UPI0004AFB479|nr:DUF2071 domain-containing protein [Gorillibacterium massiliense]
MHPDKILQVTGHRPFPMPEGKWLMKQIWRDVLLAHWSIDPDQLAPRLPNGLELDLMDDKAWLTLTPFQVKPMRLRGVPPFPPFAFSFYEINVRTYVTYKSIPGIYTFSLDASSWLAVEMARWIPFPFLHAKVDMRGEGRIHHFRSNRTDSRDAPAAFQCAYVPSNNSESFHAPLGTPLHWLTERYRLYGVRKGKIIAEDIHHLPWPLKDAEVVIKHNSMVSPLGIHLANKASLTAYSKRLEVLIWPARQV